MIEIQHGEILFIVFYETYILGIGLKMDGICVIYILSYQSFNDLFEVKPSRNMKNLIISLTKRYTSESKLHVAKFRNLEYGLMAG